MRIIDYVEDTCRTFANISDNFIPGEVYNVGGRPEWEMETVLTFLLKIMVIEVDEIEFSEMHLDINTCEFYELNPEVSNY